MLDSFPLVITLEKNALVTSKVMDLTKLFISFYSHYTYWPIFGQWNHSTFLLLKYLWCLVFWNNEMFQDHVLCLPQTCKQTSSRISGPFYWEMKRSTFWWQPTPVLLPGKSHGQRSLIVHGVAELDTTERLHFLMQYKRGSKEVYLWAVGRVCWVIQQEGILSQLLFTDEQTRYQAPSELQGGVRRARLW